MQSAWCLVSREKVLHGGVLFLVSMNNRQCDHTQERDGQCVVTSQLEGLQTLHSCHGATAVPHAVILGRQEAAPYELPPSRCSMLMQGTTMQVTAADSAA